MRPYICRQYATPCSPIFSLQFPASNLQSPFSILHSIQSTPAVSRLLSPVPHIQYLVYSPLYSLALPSISSIQPQVFSLQLKYSLSNLQYTAFILQPSASSLQPTASSSSTQPSVYSFSVLLQPSVNQILNFVVPADFLFHVISPMFFFL